MKELDNRLMEMYREMARGQGINDSLLTELFARLYLEPEPIAMDRLAKDTGYSLASISNKIRMLGSALNIRKIRKPGSKRIYLYMEKDIVKIWGEALVRKEEYVISKAKDTLPAIIKEYRKKASTDRDKKKLRIVEKYYSQILKFEHIIKKLLKGLQHG